MSAPDPVVRLDAEVVDTLGDQPDLLAFADAIASTQDRHEASVHRTRRRVLAVPAAAVLLAAVLAVVAPWRGQGGGVVQRALAAVGEKPVLHAVIESVQPQTAIVDLATGNETPATQRLEYWFDTQRKLLRVSSKLTGAPAVDVLKQHDSGYSPAVNPALERFATGKQSLSSGEARETGRGSLGGRPVIWLELSLQSSKERVAIDAATYRPVLFAPMQANGKPGTPVWHVRSIETIERRAADFSVPPARSGGSGGTPGPAIFPERAASLLGWTPVWLGRSFGGLPLNSTRPEKLSNVTAQTPIETGLALSYGRGTSVIFIREAPHAGLVNGFFPGDVLPEAGTAVVVRTEQPGSSFVRSSCRAKLRAGGLWVTITAWNNDACVAAARAVVPLGSPLVNRPTTPIRAIAPVLGPAPNTSAVSGPPATPAICVTAWNDYASSQIRALVMRGRPRSAFVLPATSSSTSQLLITWGPGAPAATRVEPKGQSAGCRIQFFLRDGSTMSVPGIRVNGTWAWLGPIPIDGRPGPDANASVSAEGALRLNS